MEEQEEFGNRGNGFSGRLNYRSKLESFPQEDFKDSFRVISAFNYETNPSTVTTKKSPKMIKAFGKTQEMAKTENGENPKLQTADGNCNQQGRTSPATTTRIMTTENEEHGLNDLFLLGKSIQDPTGRWRRHSGPEAYLSSRKNEEKIETNHYRGLYTFPPSLQERQQFEDVYPTRKTNYDDVFLNEGRPLLTTRSLGEPLSSYKEWQKSRQKDTITEKLALDELIAAGKPSQFSKRQMSGPASLNRRRTLSELNRTSSSNSLKNAKLPRSRSASLPVQSKLDLHVVLDWKEKKNGVTYVTPFLKTPESEEPTTRRSLDTRESSGTKDQKNTIVQYPGDLG